MREREPVHVFVSYAPEDSEFFEAFKKHLATLRRRGLIEVWHEGQLIAGATFADETRAQIDRADVVVLLVSPDFVESDRCWEDQLGQALERQARGELVLVPIRIRPVHTEGAPFERFQMVPRDGKAIGAPENDAAWEQVAEELTRRLETSDEDDPRRGQAGLRRGAHRGDLDGRPDDFRARVERLCRLREKGRMVRSWAPPPFAGAWEIEVSTDPIEVKPVAALDGLPTREIVFAFDALIEKRYRGDDPHVRSMLVYRGDGGAKVPDALETEARRKGIVLKPIHALNRLIDFGAYLERLRARLMNDPVYPQDLYIEQRGLHVVGRNGHQVPDALDEVWCLVTDDRQPRFLLVLADFGTGKTFLLRQLAARLAEPGSDVVPVLVELREIEKARSLDVLLTQHFALAGERSFDLDAFYHMLEQGKIALLFDGFDELVPRVTFDRAAEHLETLIEAARGKAKVVITSRTQHFLSDKEVELALARRADRVPHRQMFKLLPFSDEQIQRFLVRKLGSEEAAARRFALLGQVTDLLGLSHNPRMLSFIAEIEEDKLLEARSRTGQITKAELYTLLIERWIGYEFKRAEFSGVPTLLNPPDRWRAVLVLAEKMWGSGDKGVDLRELPEDLRDELVKLGPPGLEVHVTTHHAVSGTLLVRDDAGRFTFLHRSILEFAAAWSAALALRLGRMDSRLLVGTEMTELMAEFLGELATPEKVVPWGQTTLEAEGTSLAKKNAQRVLDRLPDKVRAKLVRGRVVRRNEVIRGESFAGQDLRVADFSGSDLSETVFTGANLTGANLANAKLVRAEMTNALLVNVDLRGANLSFARLSGADLRGAKLEGAVLRYARLIGAKLNPGALDSAGAQVDVLGACPTLPTRVAAATLPGLSACLSVAVSPDGELLASGHSGGTVVLRALGTGQPLRVWGAHRADVNSVAFSPDGVTLASGSDDSSVRVWRIRDGAALLTLQGHSNFVRSVAFSPDGVTLASGSADSSVRVWRMRDGASLLTLEGHSGYVNSVAFSPDGVTLASGSADNSVRVWRARDGARLLTLQGHSRPVNSVAFSPDGVTLASGSDDKSVRVWRARDGASLLTLQGHSSYVTSVVFSPDGVTLASGSGDNSARIWRAGDGASLLTLKGHSGSVRSVAFSPDGVTLASGSDDKSMRVWRAGDGASLLTLKGHYSFVTSVAFSPDGLTLASGSGDNAVRLWRLADGASFLSLIQRAGSVTSVAFSPDGLTLAAGSDDTSVIIRRVRDGAPLLSLRGHSGSVTSVVFSPDGLTLASSSLDHSVRLWRRADGVSLHSLQDPSGAVRCVAFSPDGLTLASGSDDNSVRVWRARDGALLLARQGHSLPVTSVAFSPDGLTLASGSHDSSVRVWRARDAALLTLRGHSSYVTNVAFSPDGLTLSSGSGDNSVRVWRVRDGASLLTLQGHSNSVTSVAFSPNGLTLASGSSDNTIRLWRIADGRHLATLYATSTGWVAFTSEGRYKLSGDLRGSFWHVIGLCRFEPGELDEHLPGLRMADDEPLFTL